MPSRFQPSLKALRSFEAAVRLESLTLAAHELNVSVSAVAFQVRQVEAGLGCALARRSGRGLAVTEAGKALARELAASFSQIEASLARFNVSARGLTVTMLTSFAALWLLPRLPGFRAAHPNIDIRILTSERLVDLASEGVDCAIRCGPGAWSGYAAEPLFPQQLAPLCHPAHPAVQLRGDFSVVDERDLIVNSLRPDEWKKWFAASGKDACDPPRAQRLDGRELIAEAVFAGLGVGLMDTSFFAAHIEEGRLVQLAPAHPTGWSHCLVVPETALSSVSLEAFASWLFAQAKASRSGGAMAR